jgi:hypothetical protein
MLMGLLFDLKIDRQVQRYILKVDVGILSKHLLDLGWWGCPSSLRFLKQLQSVLLEIFEAIAR